MTTQEKGVRRIAALYGMVLSAAFLALAISLASPASAQAAIHREGKLIAAIASKQAPPAFSLLLLG